MSMLYILLTIIGSAFIIVVIGKVIAARLDKDARPNQSRGARLVDTITSLIAALIILGGIFFTPGFLSNVGASGSSNTGSNADPLNCVAGAITVYGSSALAPLVQIAATDYHNKCAEAQISIHPTASQDGLAHIGNCPPPPGNCQVIGDSDIPFGTGQSNLIDHTVAVVVYAMIINSDVTGVSNLSTNDIQGIYKGSITDWSQVGGPKLPIKILNRPDDSGTRRTFERFILGTLHENSGTVVYNQMEVAVGSTPGAIGYIGLANAMQASNSKQFKVISIDNNAPTKLDLVKTNSYKFWNFEHMYTKGIPPYNSLVRAFIQYVMYLDSQTVESTYYVNFNDLTLSGLTEHNGVPPM